MDIVNKVIPVLIAGLFFGAGLPALYALGLRMLAGRTEYTADGKLVEIEPPGTAARSSSISRLAFGISARVTTTTTISSPEVVERVIIWRTRPRPVCSS